MYLSSVKCWHWEEATELLYVSSLQTGTLKVELHHTLLCITFCNERWYILSDTIILELLFLWFLFLQTATKDLKAISVREGVISLL